MILGDTRTLISEHTQFPVLLQLLLLSVGLLSSLIVSADTQPMSIEKFLSPTVQGKQEDDSSESSKSEQEPWTSHIRTARTTAFNQKAMVGWVAQNNRADHSINIKIGGGNQYKNLPKSFFFPRLL